MSKHMKFKYLREVEYMNFQKIGYTDITPFVYVSKEEINKYMQYEISMTVCMGRITNRSPKMTAI